MTSKNVERFRILIIGNANAGKTTILEKICHAQGRKPDFLDAEGNKVDSELNPSIERGEHDIEHQIVYPTAHGFIFHDSRGFEAGSTEELLKVKEFINKRTKMSQMKDQLHAIWYCLPTSNDRPLTKAEMSLFESDTGNVPVIAVFTKMDALDKKAFSDQLNKGVNFREAKKQAPSLARAAFERDYLKPLKKVSHRPKNTVELREMNKPNKNCDELVMKTAEALNGQALELLFMSAQRNNIEFTIEKVINEQIIPLAQAVLNGGTFSEKEQRSLLYGIMDLFPHSLPSFAKEIHRMDQNAITAMRETTGNQQQLLLKKKQFKLLLRLKKEEFEEEEERREQFLFRTGFDIQHLVECSEILLDLVPLMFSSYLPCQVIIIGTAILFTLVDSLFALTILSGQTSQNHLVQKFQLGLELYTNSFSFKNFVVAVENTFYESNSVLAGDGNHIFNLIKTDPFIAKILSTN